MTAATSPRRRAGFTLVELLAVIALMIVLAALSVSVLSSGAIGSQRLVTAADKVSGWLLIAKNRAARDRSPRGVRFYRSSDPLLTAEAQEAGLQTNWFVGEAQYIDGSGGQFFVPNPTGNPTGVILHVVRNVNGATAPNWDYTTSEINVKLLVLLPTSAASNLLATNNVVAGNLLIVPDLGRALRLESDPVASSLTLPTAFASTHQAQMWELPISTADQKALETAFGAAYTKQASATGTDPIAQTNNTFSTLNFAFQPQPQPLFGEPVVQMGSDVVLDVRPNPVTVTNLPPTNTTNTSMGVPLTDSMAKGYFDIIFSPSGEVVGQSAGIISLWVRDPKRGSSPTDFDNAGEQVLVCVYTRTGAVATQPVNTDGTDPFKFARDGINAGF